MLDDTGKYGGGENWGHDPLKPGQRGLAMHPLCFLPGLVLNAWLVIYAYDNDLTVFLIGFACIIISAVLLGWSFTEKRTEKRNEEERSRSFKNARDF